MITRPLTVALVLGVVLPWARAEITPVVVTPVQARHGLVVAGHPEATAAGVAVLQAGGNAIDAAITVSLALGVAEPYGSGLGGKLMLLYYDAAQRKTYALDATDATGESFDVAAYLRRPEEDHNYGYGSAALPGLAAGLWRAHQLWGHRPWKDDVAPAIDLARRGFIILPKTRDFFAEQEKKLRQGDAEIAKLYLPDNALPVVGTRLANPDLAHTMELLAAHGRDGFYHGPVAAALVAAAVANGGGTFNLDDLARYEPRVIEPIGITFRSYHLLSAPPPVNGPPQFLVLLKALETADFAGGPLRSAAQLDQLARFWRATYPRVQRAIADTPTARDAFARLISPDSLAEIRAAALRAGPEVAPVARLVPDGTMSSSYEAATTHFAVVDAAGNIVCATQSLSYHFGAGVVAPGTGFALNDSMSNFAYADLQSVNAVAAGKRPRSTIAPTLVFQAGRPILAIGIPGSARIPTAMLQALLDYLVYRRPLAEAIGDTRLHFDTNWRRNDAFTIEAERSLPAETVAALKQRGWAVSLPEEPGRGRHFGGINAIELKADGSCTGYADPRRTNAAAGY